MTVEKVERVASTQDEERRREKFPRRRLRVVGGCVYTVSVVSVVSGYRVELKSYRESLE